MFATELMVFFVCFDCFFLMLFFLFPSVHYHSNMHAGMFFFVIKISYPSIQPSIHSLFHLATFLSNLPAGHEKNETVAVVCRE